VGGAYASEFGETEEILKTRAAVDKFAAEVIKPSAPFKLYIFIIYIYIYISPLRSEAVGETEEILKTRAAVDKFAAEVLKVDSLVPRTQNVNLRIVQMSLNLKQKHVKQ